MNINDYDKMPSYGWQIRRAFEEEKLVTMDDLVKFVHENGSIKLYRLPGVGNKYFRRIMDAVVSYLLGDVPIPKNELEELKERVKKLEDSK